MAKNKLSATNLQGGILQLIMRFRLILKVLGFLLVATGLTMLTALPFTFYYGDPDAVPIVLSAIITAGVGGLLWLFFRRNVEELRAREGFAIVGVGWVAASAFGSLPYMLSGVLPSFTDAFFETISGFTTTGASVITDVEIVPHGILYWRALSNWLGGMGIIVLSLAILPLLGVGGMRLFKAEVSGPAKDKLTPRIIETARILWGVYLLITAAETFLLMLGGMSFFDALCHSFSTIATGGFSTKNQSIAFYDSSYIEIVVCIFMLIGGSNFALHYAVLNDGIREYLKDNEFVFFVTSYFIAVLIVTTAIASTSYAGNIFHALRAAVFNVMSVMTTTGFATADFALWAPLAQLLLLYLMFPGASAGSTGGGLKNVRVVLLLKSAASELEKLLHPQRVVPVRYNESAVEQEMIMTLGGFFILYLLTFSSASIILAATGLDLTTSMSATAACLANVGPGLGGVGPMANYEHLTDLTKWVLSFCMLAGRLEIYTVFVLFSSSLWKT